jgi:type I restriction enzyme S subunit
MSYSEWKNYKLSELVDIIGGGTPRTTNKKYWNGKIPWISVKDFNGERKYIKKTEKSITEKGLEESSTKLLEKGDVIISARGTVGELAMIDKPMAFNQSCYGLRPKKEITSEYLYYLMLFSLKSIKSKTHGAVFDTITKDTFDVIKVNIPSNISAQKSITNILSTLDQKIELNNNMNKILEETAQLIYKAWFVDFRPFKDNEFIKGELGLIPKGWQIMSLDNYFEFERGIEPGSKNYSNRRGVNDEKFIRVGDLGSSNRKTVFINKSFIDEKKYCNYGDVLVSFDGTIGKITNKEKGCYNSGLKRIFPKDKYKRIFNSNFVFLMMNSRRILNTIHKYATGTTILHASKSVSHLKHPFPSDKTLFEDIVTEFKELINPLLDKTLINHKENLILKELRDSLISKLLSKELDLNE